MCVVEKTVSELIWHGIKSPRNFKWENLLFKWTIIQAGLGGPAAEKVFLIPAAWLWMPLGDIAELHIICSKPEPFDSPNKLPSVSLVSSSTTLLSTWRGS